MSKPKKKIDVFYRGDLWVTWGYNKFKKVKTVKLFHEDSGFSKAKVELEITAETSNYRWIEVKKYENR